MAAALRAAEGGGYIFSKSSGGYFQNFSGQGGYTPLPPYSRPLDARVQQFSMQTKSISFASIIFWFQNNKTVYRH